MAIIEPVNARSYGSTRGVPCRIGYAYMRWNELNEELPYRIDTSKTPFGITRQGKPTEWVVRRHDDFSADEDYAIVARLVHPDTGARLVWLSGVDAYGTEAAADLVTNEEKLSEALHGLPADWPRRNLELVLHMKVFSDAPGAPRVVARETW